MNNYRLQVEPIVERGEVSLRWFGASAFRPEGELTLPLIEKAAWLGWSEPFTIDLRPLAADVAAGLLEDEEALAAADDLRPLHDLIGDDGLASLCDRLFPLLLAASKELALCPGAFIKAWGVEGPPERWADPDRRLVRLWYGTNRKREIDGDPAHCYSASESADKLDYGECRVFIPQSHKPGSTGTPWWRRWIRLEADDSLELRRTQPLPEGQFWRGLQRALGKTWPDGERNLFVLIHGYNVSFAEAAIRAAQLGYDLKLPGEIAFFSWPSRGGVIDYWADEATIGASIDPLAEFLSRLSEQSGAERIHLFVHSMGNRGFLAALERMRARDLPRLSLGQLFFCAPDEDARTFADRFGHFAPSCENRTLLVSPDDKAVALSRWKHQHDRVGIVPPVQSYSGMETIAVSGFGILELGHGYFAEAGPVIEDIREAIEGRRPAAARVLPKPRGDHFTIDAR